MRDIKLYNTDADANEHRHSDENAALPTAQGAPRVLEFAKALGGIVFVLPATVAAGRRQIQAQAAPVQVGAPARN